MEPFHRMDPAFLSSEFSSDTGGRSKQTFGIGISILFDSLFATNKEGLLFSCFVTKKSEWGGFPAKGRHAREGRAREHTRDIDRRRTRCPGRETSRRVMRKYKKREGTARVSSSSRSGSFEVVSEVGICGAERSLVLFYAALRAICGWTKQSVNLRRAELAKGDRKSVV